MHGLVLSSYFLAGAKIWSLFRMNITPCHHNLMGYNVIKSYYAGWPPISYFYHCGILFSEMIDLFVRPRGSRKLKVRVKNPWILQYSWLGPTSTCFSFLFIFACIKKKSPTSFVDLSASLANCFHSFWSMLKMMWLCSHAQEFYHILFHYVNLICCDGTRHNSTHYSVSKIITGSLFQNGVVTIKDTLKVVACSIIKTEDILSPTWHSADSSVRAGNCCPPNVCQYWSNSALWASLFC